MRSDILKVYTKVKLVNLGGIEYLGILRKTTTKLRLTSAIKDLSEYMRKNLDRWLLDGNGGLHLEVVCDRNQKCTVRELSLKDKQFLARRVEAFKEIKEVASGLWENKVYMLRSKLWCSKCDCSLNSEYGQCPVCGYKNKRDIIIHEEKEGATKSTKSKKN